MKTILAAAACLWFTASAVAQPTQELRISRSGSMPAAIGSAENFTGHVQVEQPFRAEPPGRAGGALVSFDPGARTAWHTHPLGQTLVVTQGLGRVQHWGGPVQEIRPGDVVWIPPGTRHWHGAAPASGMSHIAIAEQLDGKSVDWLEHVSEAQYRGPAPLPAPRAASAPAQQTRAQSLFGDVNPKLAQLTDDVLFGDVWARPGLSQRDRSLVTVSALIAMNRPDQLRSHLQRARDNGLSEAELVEAITHLAFYTGWPSAITASTVARDVFQKK